LFNKMVEMKHIIIDDDVVMQLLLGFFGFLWIIYYLNSKWSQLNIIQMNRQTSSPWKHGFNFFKEWNWFILILLVWTRCIMHPVDPPHPVLRISHSNSFPPVKTLRTPPPPLPPSTKKIKSWPS
jgi:hypothetical protein